MNNDKLLKKLNAAAKELAPKFGATHAKIILTFPDGMLIEGGSATVPNEMLYQALMQAACHAIREAQSEHINKFKPYLNS